MVSIRPFTSFLFGLTFFITLTLYSFAFSHKDMEEKQVLIAAENTFILAERNPLSISKENLDAVPTREEARIEEIGGRKMMKKEMFKEQRLDIVDRASSFKISGATSDNLKQIKRSKPQSIDSINLISDTSNSIKNVRHRRSMKVRMSDSVSLNADYKAPKSHPPKNN